ncbi:secreted Ly-6/uPAR-related protein 1-like isoform X1 [Bufo gargarizans]|uniref:secreted Ly-6/uPAR-related protein 1-like isoform X1 n=1 Tax=Bufo gargarizans TaxID=30331 RepID=UPI001CF42EA1|nr:secreted Ly-6/uPAR-related protein 1-like isoform X1 [Bufo gargarizans]
MVDVIIRRGRLSLRSIKPYIHSALITAQSLQCYFCYEMTEVQSCNQIKECPQEAKGCKTVTMSPNTGYPFVSGNELVTRDCATNCFQSDSNSLGEESQVYCCKGDLCNQLYELYVNYTSQSLNSSPSIMKGGTYGGFIPGLALLSLGLFV